GLHGDPARLVALPGDGLAMTAARAAAALAVAAVLLAAPPARGDGPTPAPPAPAAPAAPAAQPPPDDEGPPRLSLATEADREAWKRSGFRLGIGFIYRRMEGVGGAPSGRLLGPTLRVGLRLDAAWSVMASFQYAGASAAGGLAGLRFAGTIDPTWHVTRNLSLAVGFGFGGIVEVA